jgi:acyl-CoA synthetase (AMP-forming)/AMP-acid ligase II
MIHTSPLPEVDIPDTPLTPYVLALCAAQPDVPALIDGPSGRTISYGDLDRAVRSLAGGLVAHGLAAGEVVALMAPNIPEYAVVFHGVAFAGGVVTTVNPTYTEREVRTQLLDSGARMLVTIAMFLEVAQAAVVGTDVTEVYLLGEVPEGAVGVAPLAQLFGAPLAEQVPVSPEDLVCLPYSSGTTGVSKGVMLSHRNLVANIAQVVPTSQLQAGEVLIAVLPFFHIYGMQVLMNCGLRVGATVVTMPRFDLAQFLELHQKYGVTRSFVAPPIVVALAKHPIVADYDLSSLKQVFSGAAPLSAELGLECAARLGCEVVQGYGMTEMSPVSHLAPPGAYRPGSVGVTAPSTELRIVNPIDGSDLDVDEDGELWIRGPQVMKGYLANPVATELTLDPEGWLHTGDIGHVDAEGYVFVVDRLKELIKVKGFQVPPAELESLLLTHPAVADAAVIGLPDEESGEIPVGYVVLKAGATEGVEQIQQFVASQVAGYKQLRRLTVVEAIPKSASGKILRRVLRDQAKV